jgi:nucleoside-diphosphate-sugar epimerase
MGRGILGAWRVLQTTVRESHLLIFGLGYTGRAVAEAALAAGFGVTGTYRAHPPAPLHAGVSTVAFAAAAAALAGATHILATAPPPGDGGEGDGTDPVLAACAAAIRAAPRLRWAGYLSSIGVYGDRGGGWVDEATPPAPGQERSRRRLAAEQAWAALGDRLAVDLFRVAGIYGPGRSALDELRAGRARRVLRPGHCFSRIHRDDIAAAVLAAMRQPRGPGVRVLHLADDEPAEPAAVVEEAARLLGRAPPPAIAFAEAAAGMSPMGRSFWQESRRVRAAQTQAALGITWRYRTYREGLRAILAAEQGDGPA